MHVFTAAGCTNFASFYTRLKLVCDFANLLTYSHITSCQLKQFRGRFNCLRKPSRCWTQHPAGVNWSGALSSVVTTGSSLWTLLVVMVLLTGKEELLIWINYTAQSDKKKTQSVVSVGEQLVKMIVISYITGKNVIKYCWILVDFFQD